MAPHGNEDSLRKELSNDCTVRSFSGLWFVELIALLKKRTVNKVEVKSTFPSMVDAQRNIGVKPHGERYGKPSFGALLSKSLRACECKFLVAESE